MAQINQERIANLVPLDDDEVDDLIKSSTRSSKWAMAVDYTVPDGVADGSPVQLDQGSKHITIDRVGLLTSRRTVPQSMLPHSMDRILDGTMVETGSGSSRKWTFTTFDNPPDMYVCPGPPASGETRPSIDTIYRDRSDPDNDGNYIYTQYRYVPDDNADVGTADETGHFVPIPSDLVMVNGNGTVVTDNLTDYTRRVDVAIGAPCAEVGTSNSILLSSGKLVHATTAVTPGTYPSSEPSSLSFGSSFNVSSFTVNQTGHITGTSTTSLAIPSTAAGTSTAGLVKLGATADIRNIGSAKSAGTVTPNPYVKVAAADHVHAASRLRLTNINDSSFAGETLDFNGSADKTYDFWNILKAYLPSAGPTAANQFLVSSGTTAANRRAAWTTADSVLVPEYAMADIVERSVDSTARLISLSTSTGVSGGSMSVAESSVTGLKEGKAYILCFYFSFSHATATPSLEDVSILIEVATASSVWTGVSNPKYVIDGSLAGVPNYVNGSVAFVAPAGLGQLRIRMQTGNSSWTVNGNVQVAEVK